MKIKLNKQNKVLIAVGIAIVAVIIILALQNSNVGVRESDKVEETGISEGSEEEITPILSDYEIKTTSDGTKYIVEPSKIGSGGPPKGGIGIDRGIPALAKENIKFVSVSEADTWIEDNELVLALIYKDVKRVYPLQIMVFHEIANDEIDNEPVLVTYCPLCGSGIAYERTVDINGQKVETRFGTSGKLYNSNLVMYDEETDTYWTQIDGLGIVGELTGQELKEISVDTVVWRSWKNSEYSEGSQVLSQDTGFPRSYGNDPYGSYYENSFIWFPLENEDEVSGIHPKTVIFGIEINKKFKAYKEEDLIELTTIEDTLNGINIKVERDNVGIVKVTNLETNEEIVKERDFWFSWYAFHPETELYEL